MRFSKQERQDLFIAWVLISVAFTIALRQTSVSLLENFLISIATVGVGFIAHELAHKYVAQHYNKSAEFKASISMLLLSVVIAFSGIVIAAPGAVVISGFVSQRQSGLISAAGPATNIVLALLFLPVFLAANNPFLLVLASFGFLVNAWLALFNLIPFWVFDGAKIIAWNKTIYAILVTTSLLLVFLGAAFVMPGV